MKRWMLLLSLCALGAHADDKYEGLWQGYDGEWLHVSKQLVQLADAIPADKYGWRPAPGVRSVSEVLMHVAVANYGLLANTGVKLPDGFQYDMETKVTGKAEVIDWLKRSQELVKTAHLKVKPADLARKARNGDYTGTVDGMYLRILVHANEHMGQLVAYARMMGIVPPWSQ
jgi:uncharacterized damage-inducible protein DinB